jgi:hypothetical protein
MQEADGCRAAAALNGSLTSADFRVGTLFSTVFTDFHIVQAPQAGAPGQLPPGHPQQGGPGGQQVTMPKGQTTVSLPDAVKGKWKSVGAG